ncbi:Uncharacterised protein [Cedecea lapagei]|uniref:Uncharacterized protein n=1 Tax=Cedecea lapagei TaxID=158823 RepID=A0A3S4ILE3_9ENTR|nr:hypothetical protein [Cedecea lapagei]VEC02020.1 Uncharacterised protein [Cedecea lapagei]
MEQLQRLASTIAETYIRDLKRETGDNTISIDGYTGTIEASLLASGLLDNAVSSAKDRYTHGFETKAYMMLANLICLDGKEYQLTTHGMKVIDFMIKKALKKQSNNNIH